MYIKILTVGKMKINISKKMIDIILLITVVFSYVYFYSLMGNQYYSTLWAFRSAYPSEHIKQYGDFPSEKSFEYLIPDTTFYPIQGYL